MSILLQQEQAYAKGDLESLLEEHDRRETRSSFWMLLMRLLKLR